MSQWVSRGINVKQLRSKLHPIVFWLFVCLSMSFMNCYGFYHWPSIHRYSWCIVMTDNLPVSHVCSNCLCNRRQQSVDMANIPVLIMLNDINNNINWHRDICWQDSRRVIQPWAVLGNLSALDIVADLIERILEHYALN